MAISQQEQTALRSFVYQTRRLEDHSLVKTQAIRASMDINYDMHTGGSITYYKLNEELLNSFLMTLRLFYMNKENIFVRKIMSIVGREFQGEDVKFILKELKDLISSRGKHGMITINILGQKRTPEDVWQACINAERFHNDMEQQAVLRELQQVEPIAYTSFMNTVTNRTKVVMWLRHFLEENMAGVVS